MEECFGNHRNGEVSDGIAGIRTHVKKRFCGTEPLLPPSVQPCRVSTWIISSAGTVATSDGRLFGTAQTASGLDFRLCRPCLQCGRVGFDQDESSRFVRFPCLFRRSRKGCGFRRHFLCFGFRCRALRAGWRRWHGGFFPPHHKPVRRRLKRREMLSEDPFLQPDRQC